MNASPLTSVNSSLPQDRCRQVVARLQESQIFRDYQEAFQMATGLPLVLRPVGSFEPPLAGAKNIASFCSLMAGANKVCAACLQLQAEIESQSPAEPTTAQCFAGLSESVVPIRVGDNVIAYLQTGQVLLHRPTEKGFHAAMTELEKWKPVADIVQLKTAFFETRVLTKARYGAMLRLLWSFAQHLSIVSNELVLKQATAEPPAVVKARAFIAEHLDEELSLEQVARASGMSPFYFCKVFKHTIGLTFTNYVGRARVEKTKQLLLDPHKRVSEAAYESGFQSLSQFNRVFRRVEGRAPSDYREKLHGKSASTLPFAA